MMNNYEVEIKGFQSYVHDEDHERLIGVGVIKCLHEIENKLSINISDNKKISLSEIKVEFYNTLDTELNLLSVKINEDEIIFSCISLSVTPDQFSMVRNASNNSVITIRFDIPKDRQFKEEWYSCKLTNRSFIYHEHINHQLPQLDWRDIYKITDPWFLSRGRGSQLNLISEDLINSLKNWISMNPTKHMLGYFPDIHELICELRASVVFDNNGIWSDNLRFKNEHNSSETARTVPELFLKSIEDEPDELQKKLKWKYDNVWESRPNIFYFLNNGIVKRDISNNQFIDHPSLSSASLEEIAAYYICRPWMESSYLEWILIDALIFNESSLFALKTKDFTPKKSLKLFLKLALKQLSLFVHEIFYLLITTVISSLIDNQKGIIFWIIFSTITLIRWLKPTSTIQTNQLANDMIIVSDKARNPNFNSRLLRKLLYDLEIRGAIYSPWIFNLLDKRISRENKI